MGREAAGEAEYLGQTGAVKALLESDVLILRGALSDILARGAAERMDAELPSARLVEVPGIGHAPTLDEWQAVAAIDVLLDRVSA